MKSLLRTTSGWHEGDAGLTNTMLVVLGLVLVGLAHQFTVEIDHFVLGFDKTSLASVLVYLVAVLVVRTQPVNRATLGIIVGFSIPMFVATYLTDPYLSSDIYRYVWDGMVQHHHINPYRYVPGNPALTFLRAPNQDVFDNINRRDYAPTMSSLLAKKAGPASTWAPLTSSSTAFPPTTTLIPTSTSFVATASFASSGPPKIPPKSAPSPCSAAKPSPAP